MKVSASILLAAALGVSAHPSGHAHKHAHRSLEARGDFVMAAKPSIPEPKPTTTTAAPPPPPSTTSVAPPPAKTTAAAPKPDTVSTESTESTDDSSDKPSSGGSKSFCGGNSKRATLGEIAYAGNIGTSDNYGCNLQMVDSADGYDFTSTFTNGGDDDQSCVCWLKIGPTGGINGFFKGNQVLSFDLPSGGSKVMAAEANSQGGCACGSGEVPLTGDGQFGSTWYEFDYANESNQGWSGMDISSIVPGAAGLDIAGMKACVSGEAESLKTCSKILPGGETINAFGANDAYEDGLGLNLKAAKSAHIDVTVNWSG